MKYIKLLFAIGLMSVIFTNHAMSMENLKGDACPTPAFVAYVKEFHKTIGVDKLNIEWSTHQFASVPVKFLDAEFYFYPLPESNGTIICNYVDTNNFIISLHPTNPSYYEIANINFYSNLWRFYYNYPYLFICPSIYVSECPFDFNP